MNKNVTFDAKRSAIKIGIMAVITLILLIPLSMIKILIKDREVTKYEIIDDVKRSYAGSQIVDSPIFDSEVVTKDEKTNKDSTLTYSEKCAQVDIKAEINTDELHRSIYDVIVYNSAIDISGKIEVTENALKATTNTFLIGISDFKGLSEIPQLQFGGKNYKLSKYSNQLKAEVELPEGAKVGDFIDFKLALNLKGTESLEFKPSAKETSLTMNSTYPHPSFQGEFLPTQRDVRADGFNAAWNVLDININGDEYIESLLYNENAYEEEMYGSRVRYMGVKLVDPADPYMQAMRSAKFGILIVLLVFVAGLFVEFITRKYIKEVQYAVIGLSLVLFYSLLLSFSEFVVFGVAYIIAALMTVCALTFYYRAILKSRSAYVLGLFVAMVYGVNYMLLQMETYALLAGSLVLFVLLCVVMYLTSKTKNNDVIPPSFNPEED